MSAPYHKLLTHLDVKASRIYRFEASHQPASMPDVYGKKETRLHGHNFQVEIFTTGETCPTTGLSVNLNDLDYFVENVINRLDHRSLLPRYFSSVYPITHEFLLSYLSREILNARQEVFMISLETDVCVSSSNSKGWAPHRVYTHGGVFMESIVFSERTYQFSANHQLLRDDLSEIENNKIYGKCTRLHGHDYILFVTIEGIPNRNTGVVVPYKKMDKCINKVIKKIDGETLSEHKWLKGKVATTENLLMALWPRIEEAVETELADLETSGERVSLNEITIQETSRNYFTYKGEKAE